MKILVVEDENALREVIVRSLEKERYVVESASSFREASLKINDYDYDCIVLDIMLPGGSGLTLLKELRALRKKDSIIIISAKDSIEDKVTGLDLGADDYLTKPFNILELKARVRALLRRSFRPEFLNRLDETILFKPLTKDNLTGIIDIMVEGLKKRLADRSLKLCITDKAKELIIERGYDPLYGARPLRRYLQSSVETLLARAILSGDIAAGSTLTVDVENDELVCR